MDGGLISGPLITAMVGGALGSSAGASLLGSTALGGALTGPIASAVNTGILGSLIGPVTTQGVGAALGGALGGAGASMAGSALMGGKPGIATALTGAGAGMVPEMAGGIGPAMKKVGGVNTALQALTPTVQRPQEVMSMAPPKTTPPSPVPMTPNIQARSVIRPAAQLAPVMPSGGVTASPMATNWARRYLGY